MKIDVIAVGKIKEKFYRDAIAEYAKRLSRYCTLEIIEIPDEKTPDQISQTQMNQIKAKEGRGIMNRIKSGSYVFALAIQGNHYSSEGLSKKILQTTIQKSSHLTFIIGGSLGLSDEVLELADEQISFSSMTFPHQLMRVILLEQIYRSYRIQMNEPYHK